MTDPPPSPSDAGQHAAETSASLASLVAPAEAAASAIDKAFGRAADNLAKSLSKAASDGKISLAELGKAALGAIEAFATSPGSGKAINGKGTLVEALGSSLAGVFGGGRADGGPVSTGGAYLVGERGPELFRPGAAGEVTPIGAGGTVVNITLPGGTAASLLRSEAQIAAALARAVSLGVRP